MTTTATAAYRVKRKPAEPPRPCHGLPAGVPKAATQARALPALLKTEVPGAQLVHQLENAPATARHTGQGVVRHYDREPRFLGEQLVDVAQQRAAAREHDATLGDVRAQFRRSLLERLLHRAYDVLQRLLQRLQNLVAIEREAARHAFGEVAALDRELAHLLPGIGRADLDLDALGGRLADEAAVVAAPVVHGTHGRDVPGRAPEHGLGLGADRHDHLAAAPGLVLHRDHRGLVEHNALVAHIDQGVRRTQIDRQIARKITAQAFEHAATGSERRARPKVARNIATVGNLSKETCKILRWFS